MALFSVVAMMRESPEIVRRFVDYYRKLGATEVFVYFNGPPEDLPPIPGATRTDCTPAFWDRYSDVPLGSLEERMEVCYRDCKTRCTTEWMLIVDADEFVFSERSIAALLDTIPDEVDSIGVPTAEAVWGPGDDLDEPFGSTYFRTKWTPNHWRFLRRLIYGTISAQMRFGVLGHVVGKHLIRTDREYSQTNGHHSSRNGRVITKPAALVSKDWVGTYVAHFDAISLERWQRKWRWRLEKEIVAVGMSRTRLEQMQMVGDAMAAGRTRQLFRRFYGLSAFQYRALALLGHGFRREHFFERTVEVEPAVAWKDVPLKTTATMSWF